MGGFERRWRDVRRGAAIGPVTCCRVRLPETGSGGEIAVYEFASGELEVDATTKESLVVRTEGRRRVRCTVKHYNLDAIVWVQRTLRHRRTLRLLLVPCRDKVRRGTRGPGTDQETVPVAWYEVSTVQHHRLEVDAMTRPMKLREDGTNYGVSE